MKGVRGKGVEVGGVRKGVLWFFNSFFSPLLESHDVVLRVRMEDWGR